LVRIGDPINYARRVSDAASTQGMLVDPARLAELMAAQPELQVVDVREPHEREAGYIEGSRHIEMGDLTGQAASIDRSREVYFYCRVGARSAMAAEAFRAAGYAAYSLDGGLVRWAEEGRPLAPDGGVVAAH
jgi:rhodanese-related sulfurtransferase